MVQTDWERLRRRLQEAADGEGGVGDKALNVARLLSDHGSYPTQQLLRRPELAIWLAESRWRFEPMPHGEMQRELEAYLDVGRMAPGGLEQAALSKQLREYRHRHLLRVFLREIEGASVRQTTAEVADVASVCLEAALRGAAQLEQAPELANQCCVIGMGKLGGRELNFSSDVDIVFAVSDDYDPSRWETTVEKVARRAVQLMDELTARGRVFRVDLRLRPQGGQGPLVPTESGLVDYYLNWGSTWERGAWLKARPVAGDHRLGARMLSRLEPFLYRRHLDFEAIDELRRMKDMIDQQSEADDFLRTQEASTGVTSQSTSPFKSRLLSKFKGGSTGAQSPDARPAGEGGDAEPRGWNIKIGKGGIREIEFFVQALQLVHCGLRPELRVRTTLEALDRLLYAGLLSATEHAHLADGYDLFRRLEHRIQMASDRQSHRLPSQGAKFHELAQRMQMKPAPLRRAIDDARHQVREIFERLFQQSPREATRATVGEDSPGALERIIGLEASGLLDESVIQKLRNAGFRRPRQVAGQLQVLRQKEYGPFSQSPASADPQVARYLLRAVRDAPDPEGALGRLVKFCTAVGDSPALWSMLADNPHAARLLIHLFGSSPPLGSLLAEEPEVFEGLIYGGSSGIVRRRLQMASDLEERLAGIGDRARRMGRIRRFHREEVVRIALHEVAGAVAVETTCRQLADLADLVMHQLFREVVAEYRASHPMDWPDGDLLTRLPLAVVAMGKWGGREMGFGSDLDFVFVYDTSSSLDFDHRSATRLAKRLVRALSAATAIGDLYEIDLRLRPSGSQGTLVVSVDAWGDYYRERAALWERQALVRARPVTGATALRERIEKQRRMLGFEQSLPDDAPRQIAVMRDNLRDQSESQGDGFDVKFDAGGLVDVEFLTQWLQLKAGTSQRSWKARSTFEVLRRLAGDADVLCGVDLESLGRDYGWLRRLECRLAISGAGPVVPARGPTRRALIRQMGHQGREGSRHFDAELAALKGRVSQAWASVFEAK